MRYVPVRLLILSVLIISSFSLADVVFGDNEHNDEQYLAESLEDGTVTGSLDAEGEDHLDWYVLDVPPFTEVEVTLQITSSSGEINVMSYWEYLEIEGSVAIFTTGSGSQDSDVFNSESSFEELWLEVSGTGSYELSVKFEQDLMGGCCGGLLILGGLPLVGSFIYIRYRKRG